MASDNTTQASQPRKVIHLPTFDTYNQWAATYDSDGNILQALDSYALTQSMFQYLVQALPPASTPSQPLYITDFGCGTGRATLLLLATLRFANGALAKAVTAKGFHSISLTGLDGSSGMLGVASQRIPESISLGDKLTIETKLAELDFLDPNASVKPLRGAGDSAPEPAHAIISTLVLEHLPLDVYFERARGMLRRDGVFLVTNMHDKMGTSVFSPAADAEAPDSLAAAAAAAGNGSGSKADVPIPTGAGFNDAATNTKIRAEMDFAHTIPDVLDAAKRAGFKLVDDRVDELSVEPWMFDEGSSGQAYGDSKKPLLGPRGRKWVGTPCWFGMVFRQSV